MNEGVRKQKKFITGLAVEARRGRGAAATKMGKVERDARERKTGRGGRSEGKGSAPGNPRRTLYRFSFN